MAAAVVVDGISKSYLIQHKVAPSPAYRTLRETLAQLPRRLGKSLVKARIASGTEREIFWALRDVSFSVKQGARLGIIGSNGAGKSTLLKILSRVTEPTTGRVTIVGRVASLLEVGTGFHPELTGRENIYLNGVILGMSRAEVQRRFDEIVAFAEIERFLDTPVKRYSSGMYVRLAFAIAAHLESEVLILDEVLAVGDQRFQRKCLGKIQSVGNAEGRTILFVSHSMPAVRALCSTAILLDAGKVAVAGEIEDVIAAYEEDARTLTTFGRVDLRKWKNRTNTGAGALIEFAELRRLSEEPANTSFYVGDSLALKFGIALEKTRIGNPVRLAVSMRTSDGMPLANMVDEDSRFRISSASARETVSIVLRDVRLYPGRYFLSLWVGSTQSETWDYVHDCITLEVASGGELAQRPLPRDAGLLFLTPEWARHEQQAFE